MIDQSNYEGMHGLRDDPVTYGRFALGHHYSPDQVAIARATAEPGARVAVHACHGSGKTYLAADLVLWFISTRRPAKVITTASGARSVDTQLWAEIRSSYNQSCVRIGGRMLPRKAELMFSEDHYALGFSTDDLHKFRGYHSQNLLVLVDEAAGIHPDIYLAIDGLTVGDEDRILILGNPGEPSGPYFDRCRDAGYKTFCLSAFNQPNVVSDSEEIPGMVTRRWVEDRRRMWGEGSPLWQMLVLGEFPEQGINSLVTLAWVEAAQSRVPRETDQPTVISCDVAREGTDETVILVLEDDAVTEIETYSGRDTMETVGRIMRYWKRFHKHRRDLRVVVDDIGVGGGVTDRLRELGAAVVAFKGSVKPWYRGQKSQRPDQRRERFRNLRCQSWWWLREQLREGLITIPKDERLKGQLTGVLYGVASDGTIEVESKKKQKERGLSSPDRADALVMAAWARSVPGAREPTIQRSRPTSSTGSRAAQILGV